MIEDLLSYNEEFVKNKGYEPYQTSKYPDRRLAIVTCMDTRLIELLPAALFLYKNGDKNYKERRRSCTSFCSVVRSLLIAIYELGVEEILVIGHTNCGVQHMDAENLLENMRKRGISNNAIESLRYCGIDFDRWLEGFDDGCVSVAKSVELLKKHPLIPKDVRIYGFMMDSTSGKLSSVSE